ncbi:hypothetical protein [Priestia megaterium]|uniref:hypothetical protein n=1 Tax=Priestia megaterium TaxID=1404 RepID=UPI002E204690|nr:hypothetical protein [Priestia megaterium]MED4278281.1 hypothetical protein [Priestia megaterium]MED4314386.1 hypothetical protein [Priestia megaterium]
MSLHVDFRKLQEKENPTQEDVKQAFYLAKKIGSIDARVVYSKIKRLAESELQDEKTNEQG